MARCYEKVSCQRRNFCHKVSTDLVNNYDLIAVENLNVKVMVRSLFGKSIHDASWNAFVQQLAYKAESAGKTAVRVNPKGTSQECPKCGKIRKKKLSERTHICKCGCEMQRNHAAAQIILNKALVIAGANRPWTDAASGPDGPSRPVEARSPNQDTAAF